MNYKKQLYSPHDLTIYGTIRQSSTRSIPSIQWMRNLLSDGTIPHPNKFLSITENRVYKDNQALADNDADVYLSTPLLDKVKAWNSVCLESR